MAKRLMAKRGPCGGGGSRSTLIRRGARAKRGYTAVELVLSLAVLAVGSAGIITMQRVTAEANRHAKSLAVATHIAQSWLDQLVADSSLWQASGDLTQTTWLKEVTRTGWFRPTHDAGRDWGDAFDVLGNPLTLADVAARGAFCSDLRLVRLYPDSTPTLPGTGLIRAEVRVYWLRDATPDVAGIPNQPCGWTPAQVDNASSLRAFHFVFMSTAILASGSSS